MCGLLFGILAVTIRDYFLGGYDVGQEHVSGPESSLIEVQTTR